MTARAPKAPAKTIVLGCRMAIIAALLFELHQLSFKSKFLARRWRLVSQEKGLVANFRDCKDYR
jgi:hypothetical protein